MSIHAGKPKHLYAMRRAPDKAHKTPRTYPPTGSPQWINTPHTRSPVHTQAAPRASAAGASPASASSRSRHARIVKARGISHVYPPVYLSARLSFSFSLSLSLLFRSARLARSREEAPRKISDKGPRARVRASSRKWASLIKRPYTQGA